MTNYKKFIEDHTIRCEANRRGGGIEIDCSKLFPDVKEVNPHSGNYGAFMAAYQNYLGGGMLGRVMATANFVPAEKDHGKYYELATALKQYFFEITMEEATDYDEWSAQSYNQNQAMPVSAY